MGPWEDQWALVEVGHARIQSIEAGRPEPQGTPGARFDITGFFIACHHLAEWIQPDTRLKPASRRKARRLVRNRECLRICADLANRSKHCTLTWSQTGDLSTGDGGNSVTVMVGFGASHQFYITSSGSRHGVIDVANDCVATWQRFLQDRGLLDPAA